MAKRTRYPKRPAAKAAVKRPARPADAALRPDRSPTSTRPASLDAAIEAADSMPVGTSSSLTEAEVRRAAELEAEANARERAAIAESLRRKSRGQERELVGAGELNAPLSVRAAHEYAYVARDVKRIALTASLMVAILAVLHILVNVLGVITL